MDEFTRDAETPQGPAEAAEGVDVTDEIAEVQVPLADDSERAGAMTPPRSEAAAPEDAAPAEAAAPEDAASASQASPVADDADPASDDAPETNARGAEGAFVAAAPPPPPPPPVDLRPASDIARDYPALHRRSFLPGRKTLIAMSILVLLGVLGVAGLAYATYDLSQDYRGRILPGARIAEVDVGGMDRDEAITAVRAAVRPELTRDVTLTWEDKTWTTTPKELGAKSNARAAVDAALAASGDTTFFEKARMRVLGDRLTFRHDVAIRYPYKGTKGFIAGIASSFDREARDASLDYSSGWVEVVDAQTGRAVRRAPSVAALRDALLSGTDEAELDVRTLEPEVTEDDFRQVLLLHIGDNKLYLYNDGEIVRKWTVATGEPNYMTPTGVYEVTEKRYLPTWVNPAPTTWGAGMPASIPPGPGNPLGVRAINWSAPAIRFHGTSATYSLGYNASHGCVRMSNSEVIELYDLIEVGTPIVSIVHGSLKPLYSTTSASTPTAEQSAD